MRPFGRRGDAAANGREVLGDFRAGGTGPGHARAYLIIATMLFA